MYTRILVATDGSKLSKKAVTSAISLAATCKAELLAIQVVPPYPVAYCALVFTRGRPPFRSRASRPGS